MRTIVIVTAALAALATGAVLGTAGAQRAETSAIRDFPTFLFATIAEGDLRGSVAAVQRTSAPKADLFVSLHGLAPSKAYRAAITDLGCSSAATKVDQILSVAAGTTGAGEDDFFDRTSGKLGERLARGTTVRIYEGGRQIACARANRVR